MGWPGYLHRFSVVEQLKSIKNVKNVNRKNNHLLIRIITEYSFEKNKNVYTFPWDIYVIYLFKLCIRFVIKHF